MADLPNWIYDVVMALQKWNDEHGELYMLRYDGQYIRLSGCCLALDLVPADVKQDASVIAKYRDYSPRFPTEGASP